MAKWIDNKTVIITGASSGIGKMLAERLMKEHNCKVIGVARSEKKMKIRDVQLYEPDLEGTIKKILNTDGEK